MTDKTSGPDESNTLSAQMIAKNENSISEPPRPFRYEVFTASDGQPSLRAVAVSQDEYDALVNAATDALAECDSLERGESWWQNLRAVVR